MPSLSKCIGSVLIITGTAIGGGMLALPLVTAQLGFWGTLVFLFVCWAVMTYAAILILKVNLRFAPNTSFSTMAYETIGRSGQIITWLSFLLLLYALTAAYITAGASLLHNVIPGRIGNALLFTCVLGLFVIWGTHAVDKANRILITLKAIGFLMVVAVLVPHVSLPLLNHHPAIWHSGFIALPVLITSFGFAVVIPSVRHYVGDHPAHLKRIVLIGSSIPLIIYILWEITTLGVIKPQGQQGFASIHHGNVDDLIQLLAHYTHSHWVLIGSNFFTDIAVTTSFLGVSLALYDFLADGFNLTQQKPQQKLSLAALTYIPPLLFAWFYPDGFIIALSYAGIFVAILLIILPALMARAERKSMSHWLVIVAGILVIVSSLLPLDVWF